MTIDSKSHLVALAVSTEYPVIQEDAHHRLSQAEQRAFDLTIEEERETVRTMVSRLHVELGRSDPRGLIGSLRRKHAHRLITATAKKFSRSACEESLRRRFRLVAARVLYELGTCFLVAQFEWKHRVLNLHVLGTIMVDAGSRACSVTIHRVMDVEHGLGNVTGEIAGEWNWCWRSGKHKGSRMKGGVFLGPARVLLQERETTAEGVRVKGVGWITEGTSLVRCAVQHLRSLSESEKRLCSIADKEAISFQDLVGHLPHSTFLDATTQTDIPDDAWEEEITGWDPGSTRDPSSGSSFWQQRPDATSRLGPDFATKSTCES